MTYYPEVTICKMRTLIQGLQTSGQMAKSALQLHFIASAVFRKFELAANI